LARRKLDAGSRAGWHRIGIDNCPVLSLRVRLTKPHVSSFRKRMGSRCAVDCALRFESPHNSRPSMLCLCHASYFHCLQSSCRCCRSSRRLRRFINGRRRAGTDTASCPAIISHRITAFQLRAWRAATSAPGISIQSQVITGTMATGTISAGLAFTAGATMAAASALAGRGRRSGRSGIAADQARGRAALINSASGISGPSARELWSGGRRQTRVYLGLRRFGLRDGGRGLGRGRRRG
jgi:hypothetical protein